VTARLERGGSLGRGAGRVRPPGTTVTITGLAAGGDGIARLDDGRVVFCEGALPAERVRIEVVEQRRDYARARVVEVLDASEARQVPPCPHLARGCGGCTWLHVRPSDQAPLKAGIVVDALRRIAHLPDVAVTPAPPERPRVPAVGYRTTVRLAVDRDGRPAYRWRHANETVAVDSCGVAHPLLAELIGGSRFPGAREVVLRVGARTGERLAAPDRARGVVVPEGTVVSPPHGPPAAVHEVVDGRRWRVSATSFFQPGPEAAEAVVGAVASAVAPIWPATGVGRGPRPVVADLYAGVGMLGASVVARLGGASLVSVESSPGSAQDALANLAGLDARVVLGDVDLVCGRGSVVSLDGRCPDVVVADPARPGLGPSASGAVAALGAPLIVVVSCDPASLARDAVLLGRLGYRLESVEVLDLFPGTFHVECVSRFTACAAVGASRSEGL